MKLYHVPLDDGDEDEDVDMVEAHGTWSDTWLACVHSCDVDMTWICEMSGNAACL